jgi:chitobiase/beta-hexosaminidase-like protein
MGANMRYTINGAPPTSTPGTPISGPVNVTPSPGGTTLRVIAYKAGMIDSQVHEAVFYYENDNGGNTNMAQPIDDDPGGGGIPIDGGNQPTISYDDNGNLIHYKEWNYRYDAQNRLTQAWNGTTTAPFYYDGKNRQIARNINGVIRFSAWDGWDLLEEYSSSLNVVTGYLQGATGVIKSWSAENTLYYYQDRAWQHDTRCQCERTTRRELPLRSLRDTDVLRFSQQSTLNYPVFRERPVCGRALDSGVAPIRSS